MTSKKKCDVCKASVSAVQQFRDEVRREWWTLLVVGALSAAVLVILVELVKTLLGHTVA